MKAMENMQRRNGRSDYQQDNEEKMLGCLFAGRMEEDERLWLDKKNLKPSTDFTLFWGKMKKGRKEKRQTSKEEDEKI